MSATSRWLFGIGTVLGALALVWFVQDRFEQRTIEVNSGLRGIARQNPYLAAERYLARTGIPTHKVDVLHDLPKLNEVLVLLAPRHAFGEQRTRRVIDWVARGGHLIVVPQHHRFRPDDDQIVDEPIQSEALQTIKS